VNSHCVLVDVNYMVLSQGSQSCGARHVACNAF